MYRALQKEFKRLKNKLIEINNRIAELNRERRASAGQENFFEFDKELKIFKRNREDIEDELAGLDIELQSHKQVNVVLTLMEEIKRIDEARDIKLCEKLSSILEVDSKFIKITESEPGKDRLVVILPKGLDKELISLYRRVDKRLKSLLEEFGVKDVDLPAPPWKEKSHIESVYSNLFVGREEELRKFQEMIQEHFSTPIWCIHTDGDGGIGKTQLLFQILHQCNESDRIVNCQSMIDFYSVESCSKIGLIQQVMKNLSYDGFFLETKKRINLYESTEDASERETYLPQIEEYFFEEYQEFAHKVRKKGKIIVLLFDTYEAIQLRAYENGTLKAEATSFTKWLEKDLFPKIASHTRLIVAGRYPLNDLDGKLAVTTKLKKFKYEDTIRFWLKCFDQNDKQGLLDRLSLEETGMYKFHTLADGRPILLALFVDWVKYHRPILPYQWLSAIEEEQGEIGKEASPDQKRRFEKALVERFRQIDPMERIAVTYMAIAYKRMTPEMLHNLTKYPLVDCQNALLKKLRPLSFIKYKGNGIVLLHDEMQRLIIEHWWDEQDLDRVIRKKIAQDLVDYYKEEYLSEGKEKELPLEELETYMSELIEYKFLADSEKGLERFQEEFDHGMSGGRPDYVDLIIREADDYFQKNKEDFDFPGFLRISLCQVQYYIDTNRNYELALKEINKVFSNYMDKPDWLTSDLYGHFLLQQGRAHFWLEEFDESINALTKAKRVLYLAGMDDDHYWANHWMGYVYMRQGEFAQAEHWIQKSLDGLYELIKTKGFQNLTRKHRHYIQYDLGNLAIIYRTLGQFDSAIRYGEIALGIVRQLHRNRKEIARVRTTVGHAMAFAEYEIDARHHFDEAEKSIQGIGDRVLHGRLKTNQCWLKYRTRDFAYLLEYYRGGELLRLIEGESGFIIKRERFYKAVDLANEAIELLSQEPVIKKELADAYFTLGELFMVAQQEAGLDAKFPLPLKKPVTRANAKWKKAEAALVQAYQWGEKSKFKYRVVDSLESLITLYYFWNSTPDSTPDQKEKNRENITHYQKKFDAYNKKEMEGRGKKNYPNLFGKYEITLGDMEFDRALKLVEHPNSNLDSIAQALKKSFGHYVEAVRLMERFHIGRYYLILRILYNRLHSLFECLSPKEHMYKIAFDLIEELKYPTSRLKRDADVDLLNRIYRIVRFRFEIHNQPQEKKIEKLVEKIDLLEKEIDGKLKEGLFQQIVLLNGCRIDLLRSLSDMDPSNERYLEKVVLARLSHANYYRVLGGKYRSRRFIWLAEQKVKRFSIQDHILKTALESSILLNKGELEYRRGEYGKMLEFYIFGELEFARKKFEIQFPGSIDKARGLLKKSVEKLKKTIYHWQKTGGEIKRIRFYRKVLTNAYFRLGELVMLEESYDGEEGSLAYLKLAVDTAKKCDYSYRKHDAAQSYLNGLYFAGKYNDEDYKSIRKEYEMLIDSSLESDPNKERYESIITRFRIMQGDVIFSDCYKVKESSGEDYEFVPRYEEPDVIKLREMLECYIDACNHKILFNPDDFAAGVRVLQRRIELIPDVDSLSIIVDGLPEAWAEKKNLQNKKDELEILIMYTNLRRITLSDENK